MIPSSTNMFCICYESQRQVLLLKDAQDMLLWAEEKFVHSRTKYTGKSKSISAYFINYCTYFLQTITPTNNGGTFNATDGIVIGSSV